LGIAQARYKGEMTTELDPSQAQSALAQTEAQIPQLEIQIRQTCHRLCVLLGMPPEDLQKRLDGGRIPTAPVEVAVGIPCDLLRRRPDVRRQERLAAAQCEQIGIAKADYYPAISINGTIGYSAEYLPNLATTPAFRGGIGPGLQWKILNYGRIANNVHVQEAKFQQAVASYQNTVLKANEEAENGLVQFLRSQQRAKSMTVSVGAAEKAVKVAVAQYKGGMVDFNRVALLEQNLVQQQDLLAQSQGDIAQGLIQLYRALGGGWQIRTVDGPEATLPPVGLAASVAPSPSDLLPQAAPVDGPKKPASKDEARQTGD
jgi:NodT family efflux transporter outer membrane factor (OMF) lipoprotein